MPYADIDFFLAIGKKEDWLKEGALALLEQYKNKIEYSEATFVELMLVSVKHKLDPVIITQSAMEICRMSNQIYLKAAFYISAGIGVLDAFHAAHVDEGEIISSDSVYDKLGLKRIRLEEQ